MARIRTVKPEFWTDEKVVELSAFARLLFIGLWNFADDAGRLRYSPKRIKMQILPADDVDIHALLDELVKQSLVIVYAAGDDECLQIKNFERHQKVDKRTDSQLPPPSSAESPRLPPTPAENPQTPTTEGIKEGIKEGKGRDTPRAMRAEPVSWEADFSEFWAAYPLHIGKRAAHRAYGSALKRADHAVILAGAQRYCHDPTRKPEFTAHPATWLNADRWGDEPVVSSVEQAIARMNGGTASDEYR